MKRSVFLRSLLAAPAALVGMRVAEKSGYTRIPSTGGRGYDSVRWLNGEPPTFFSAGDGICSAFDVRCYTSGGKTYGTWAEIQ